jgi:Icc-related predicted phosphoesterase
MKWLPDVLDEHGPAARMIWLMHEPPTGTSLSSANPASAEWATAVRRFQPRLVVSEHDHRPPPARPAVASQAGTNGLCEHRSDVQTAAGLCGD